MRSRFNHDGTLDHHADNEHDLFRRADEALERQRQLDHSVRSVEQTGQTATASSSKSPIPSPLGTGTQSGAGTLAPKMPHDELAERMAVKPTTPASADTALAWPTRTATTTNTTTAARTIGRRR